MLRLAGAERAPSRAPRRLHLPAQAHRPVRARALFGRDGGKADDDVMAQALAISKRHGGRPSEAGNAAVAELVAGLGRGAGSAKSPDFSGTWESLYASGNSGLTALDGKIARFTVRPHAAGSPEPQAGRSWI